MHRLSLVAVVAVMAACSAAPDEAEEAPAEPVGSTQSEVGGGHDATGLAFDSVGNMVVDFGLEKGETCSAILVTPGYVLTAAHCLRGEDNQCSLPILFPNGDPRRIRIDFTRLGFSDHDPGSGPAQELAESTVGAEVPPGEPVPMSDNWVTVRTGPIDSCNDNDVAQDLALVRLDRLQFSRPPIHVDGDCPGGGPFTASLVGYGNTSNSWSFTGSGIHPRNTRARGSNWPFYGGWEYEGASNSWGLYKSWSEFATAQVRYAGGLQSGDSGGPLFWFGSPQRFASLCGVASGSVPGIVRGFIKIGPFPIVPYAISVIYSQAAAVDSSSARTFLQSRLKDQDGRWFGECLPEEVVPGAALDVDTDNDFIPDACDPCPEVADPKYRFTGAFSLPDEDGDGVPNACDNCPARRNPYDEDRTQADEDGDGVGDSCDLCRGSIAPVGLGDLPCCQTDADCQGLGNSCVQLAEEIDAPGGTCDSVCERTPDDDEDRRGNNCDNCPGTDNYGQQDGDGDGIGDACDLCKGEHRYPPTADALDMKVFDCTYTGLPTADAQCVVLTGHPQSRCAPQAGIFGALGHCTYGRDTDGDQQGDLCDGCPEHYDDSSDFAHANCNRETEVVENRTYPLPGDRCDPNPCPVLVSSDQPEAAKNAGPGFEPWGNLGFQGLTLPPSLPQAFPYTPPGSRPTALNHPLIFVIKMQPRSPHKPHGKMHAPESLRRMPASAV